MKPVRYFSYKNLVHPPVYFKGALFRTEAAQAVKNGPTEIHMEALPAAPAPVRGFHKPLIQEGVEGFYFRTGEIHHPAAMAAHQMGMGLYVPIKPFLPINNPKGNHKPFLPEEVDIPVYRTQGKVGNHRFELFIHPLGAGMGQGGPDHLQNGIPFFAMFSFNTVHILIIITIIKICKRIFLKF
jgi:hypothetical protein